MADETRAELRAPKTAVIAVLDSNHAGNANSSPAAGIQLTNIGLGELHPKPIGAAKRGS